MEFTVAQISYNFVQPRLLDLAVRPAACNFSHPLPGDLGEKLMTTSKPNNAHTKRLIEAAMAKKTSIREEIPFKSRRARRQELGLDQIKAAHRPSLLSFDSFSESADPDSPAAQIIMMTEKRLSLRSSFRSQSSFGASIDSSSSAQLRSTRVNEGDSASPSVKSGDSPLPAATTALFIEEASASTREEVTTETAVAVMEAAKNPSPAPPLSVRVAVRESAAVVEKGGLVSKFEIQGSVRVAVQSNPSGAVGADRTCSVTVAAGRGTWTALTSDTGCTFTEDASTARVHLALDLASLQPALTYSVVPTYQPALFKAKNACICHASDSALMVTVQIALNPTHAVILSGLTVLVSLGALLQRLGIANEEVKDIVVLGHRTGEGSGYTARRIVAWCLADDVLPTERKVTCQATVQVPSEAAAQIAVFTAESPLVVPMVVKATLTGGLLSEAKVSPDDTGEGMSVEIDSSAAVEWKYL